MTESIITARVLTVRAQNPTGIGGCIFTCIPIDAQGNVIDTDSFYVVRARGYLLGDTRVQVGQWWSISGKPPEKNELIVNGVRLTEWQIEATSLAMLLPSGEHIISLIAENEEFPGIGWVKARKLWEFFQHRIYDVLDGGDVAALSKVLTKDSARKVIAAWQKYGNTRTLQWLHKCGFDVALGRKVIAFFGDEASEKIEEDPYRLLSFCGRWNQVDSLAVSTFGLPKDDPRRLQGAIEEALYRNFGDGHTAATDSMLLSRIESVLGVQTNDCRWRDLLPSTLSQGISNGSYEVGADQTILPIGPFIMEKVVAHAVTDRLLPNQDKQLLRDTQIDMLLADHETTAGFSLNGEQRLVVHKAAADAFLLITGSAGVGKTTVLEALYKMYDQAGISICQMALAGRAAKRMQEATGRPAKTIASFLQHAKEKDIVAPTAVVIDEASMVDIITMSSLCELLPSHVRMVVVGDDGQLMPVGPGLVLHALVDIPEIPLVQLKTVNRHSGAIVEAAQAIRNGIWPVMSADETAPIAFLPCILRSYQDPGCGLAETVLRLYGQDQEHTQILSPRRSNRDGTNNLNTMCQDIFAHDAQPLLVWNTEYESWVRTGFRLGDPLLCVRNMWDYGLQNGSLGRLVNIEYKARPQKNEQEEEEEIDPVIAWAEWDDGEQRPIFEHMLDDMELGYAITIHKSQGSQWPRVIVPITGNRFLDRTLIYTAVTRAQSQVILVGDQEAARKAVESPPRASHRQVGLGSIVRRILHERIPQ